MTVYPYGPPRDAYLNVKEAAKEPWRGITAWVQGSPCLVIDKNDDAYVLENMNGTVFSLKAFQKWEPATEHSALVAASRLEGSPFTSSHDPRIGTLVYFENQWDVRLADLEVALPIESLVERYDKIRWSKTADLYPGMDYRCPQCGSREVEPDRSNGIGDSMMCNDCGYTGEERDFEDEEPDYDGHSHDDYEDYGRFEPWASVKTAEGVSSFEYNLPPAGIHMRTHAEMSKAGLQARVHFPPGLESMFGPVPEVLEVPSDDQDQVMNTMMLDNPEQYTVHVETPHDPEQVRQLFDQVGGRRAGKTAEVGSPQNEPTVDLQEAITCPKCGSHSIRAFSPNGNTATLVCLTCGNEFERDVHMNPQSSVRQSTTPLDPSMSAQIVGLMQQIEEAYQQGDHNRAQQLHQQMMQLMNNPNQPMMNTTKNSYGPQYPVDPARQAQIAALMRQITEASAEGDMITLRVLRTQLENLMGGNPAYARTATDIPLRPDQVENLGDTRVLTYTIPGGSQESIEVHADNLVLAMKDLVDRGATDIHIGGERDDTPGDLTLPPSWGKVDNSHLVDSTSRFFLESIEFTPTPKQAWVDGMDDPYADSPQNLDDYTQQGLDPTMQDDSNDVDYMHCPACDGPGVLLGSLGNRIHYLCRNCGMHFNEKLDHGHSDQVNNTQDVGPHRDEPLGGQSYASLDAVKEVNENTLRAFKDSSGNPVEAGRFYTLHHPNYKVPDVIKILNLEDGRIEASIASDEHGSFPIHITHDEAYSLDPYEPHHKSASGWSVLARKNFSAQEQRELIEENPKGRARNFDKLNLDGTHYQIKEESTDRNFLLGW